MIRDIRNIFQLEKKNYYKPVSVGNFWNKNYIEYESNGDRIKTLPINEYLNPNLSGWVFLSPLLVSTLKQ